MAPRPKRDSGAITEFSPEAQCLRFIFLREESDTTRWGDSIFGERGAMGRWGNGAAVDCTAGRFEDVAGQRRMGR